MRAPAAANPQKIRGSLTSCEVVKSRAIQPSKALNTAKADRFPVDWFCLFEMICGALEMMDRGSVANCRRATEDQLMLRYNLAYGLKEDMLSLTTMPDHPGIPIPIQRPLLSDSPFVPD